MCVNKGGAL